MNTSIYQVKLNMFKNIKVTISSCPAIYKTDKVKVKFISNFVLRKSAALLKLNSNPYQEPICREDLHQLNLLY